MAYDDREDADANQPGTEVTRPRDGRGARGCGPKLGVGIQTELVAVRQISSVVPQSYA